MASVELLAEGDRRYAEALREEGRLKHEYQAASSEAWKASQERFDRYQQVLGSGIVINEIRHRRLMQYHAGDRRAGNFLYPDSEPVWTFLDADHAGSLSGVVVADAKVDKLTSTPGNVFDAPFKIKDTDLWITMKVPGAHQNRRISTEIIDNEPEQETAYRGILRALDWRPATEDEIRLVAESAEATLTAA